MIPLSSEMVRWDMRNNDMICIPSHPGQAAEVKPLALRPREAARLLGISTRTLWSWTDQGVIPSAKVGRSVLYSVAALEKWLAERTVL
jgi:excisionase family DNA binding protein